MGSGVIRLHFKYRGPFDYKRIYTEGRAYFTNRGLELFETNYKDKGDEFEGEWKVNHKIDLYNKITYEVKFKAADMKALEGGKYNGKLIVTITAELDENYEETSIAGTKEIFHDKDGKPSLLHKLYKKVTYRDVHERIEDEAAMVCLGLQSLFKSICGMDTQ